MSAYEARGSLRPATLLLLLSALLASGCGLCWPRGGAISTCPAVDEADDDDATDDDDAGDDDDEGPDGEGMVAISGDPFLFGCDGDCDRDESPQRTLTVDAFRIDVREVTVLEFVDFLNEHGNDCGDADCVGGFSEPEIVFEGGVWRTEEQYEQWPAAEVTWYGAHEFCLAHDKRLPTEAEWERAARSTDGRSWPWGEDELGCNRAVYMGCGGPYDVGVLPAGVSEAGAFDMAGNVWEWTADWYEADYHENQPDSNPRGPFTGSTKSVRGGGFESNRLALYTYTRWSREPWIGGSSTGFRCAADP